MREFDARTPGSGGLLDRFQWLLDRKRVGRWRLRRLLDRLVRRLLGRLRCLHLLLPPHTPPLPQLNDMGGQLQPHRPQSLQRLRRKILLDACRSLVEGAQLAPDRRPLSLLGGEKEPVRQLRTARPVLILRHAYSLLGGRKTHLGLGADQPLGAEALLFQSITSPNATAPPRRPAARRRAAHAQP